jgi:hypothetical protein
MRNGASRQSKDELREKRRKLLIFSKPNSFQLKVFLDSIDLLISKGITKGLSADPVLLPSKESVKERLPRQTVSERMGD